MSFGSDIHTILAADSAITDLVSTRIWKNFRDPKNKTLPCLIYQLITGQRDYTLSGPSGLVNGQLQIDCYASTSLAAEALAGAVKGACKSYDAAAGDTARLVMFLDSEIDNTDAPADGGGQPLHRVTHLWRVQYTE